MAKYSAHDEQVDQWIREYTSTMPYLERASESIRNAVVARLSDDGLNYYHIDNRVKTADSLRYKLSKRKDNGEPKYKRGLEDIKDLIGIRVTMFIVSDIDKAAESLEGTFNVEERINKTDQSRQAGLLGYGGEHLVLTVRPDRYPDGCSSCTGQTFEVQIRTILQHAWAEFEHDVRYKSNKQVPEIVNRAFSMASGLIELADEQFATISRIVTDELAEATSPDEAQADTTLNPEIMAELAVEHLPNFSRSKIEHYAWLVDILKACGVTTKYEAASILRDSNVHEVVERMNYKLEPGHVRVIDDILLSKWAQDYIDQTESIGQDVSRRGKLDYRLRQLGRK